jgi:hypothetical protein
MISGSAKKRAVNLNATIKPAATTAAVACVASATMERHAATVVALRHPKTPREKWTEVKAAAKMPVVAGPVRQVRTDFPGPAICYGFSWWRSFF